MMVMLMMIDKSALLRLCGVLRCLTRVILTTTVNQCMHWVPNTIHSLHKSSTQIHPTTSCRTINPHQVLEYVANPYTAHQEVFRVLKPGGSHVFTVPYAPNSRADIIKATRAPNGTLVFKGAPELHKEPAHPDGLPVYRVFGRGEMLRRLCDIGFEVGVEK